MTDKIYIKGSEDLIFSLRMAVAIAGSSEKYAKQIDLGHSYLLSVINGKRRPGPKILNALGYEKHYKHGYLRIQEAA